MLTPPNQGPEPLITVHAAVILLMATVIGIVVGGLTYLSGTPEAGAALAGLIAAGCSAPALHRLIG